MLDSSLNYLLLRKLKLGLKICAVKKVHLLRQLLWLVSRQQTQSDPTSSNCDYGTKTKLLLPRVLS